MGDDDILEDDREGIQEKPLAVFYAYTSDDVDLYAHASGYLCALYDLENFVRGKLKWGNSYKTIDEALQDVIARVYESRQDYNLPE